MTKHPQKFTIDLGWKVILKDLGISDQDLLYRARLPLDLFKRGNPTLSAEEYFVFLETLVEFTEEPNFPLKVIQALKPETFSPPIFASFCSRDLDTALVRLSQYKPLIGPMRLEIEKTSQSTAVTITGIPDQSTGAQLLMAAELAFFVHIARLATREKIVPIRVESSAKIEDWVPYEDFFGVRVRKAKTNTVTFSARDAQRPFLTANDNLFDMFEPELRKRMADLDESATFRERVRCCLTEMVAGGDCSMDSVAGYLAVSPRTLQRRLKEDGSSFQEELKNLRCDLANHYLKNTEYPAAEISFLLGYQDPNSFFRAFLSWTGMTPEQARTS